MLEAAEMVMESESRGWIGEKTGACGGNPVGRNGVMGASAGGGPWLGTGSSEASQMRGGIGITSGHRGRGTETGAQMAGGLNAARWVRGEKPFPPACMPACTLYWLALLHWAYEAANGATYSIPGIAYR